jgi:hypothetical protein
MDSKSESEHTDFELRNWSRARTKFLANHHDGDQTRIDEFLKGTATVEMAKASCSKAQEQARKEYSSALGGILEKIEVAMRVGDLAMKAAPETVGLAWTGVRLCFHAVSDDVATASLFVGASSDILGILISCGVYGQMYGTQRGPSSFRELHAQVTELIPEVYTDILEFSYAMKKHVEKNKATRILKSTFNSYHSKFDLLVKKIQENEKKMREYATQASQRLSIYYHENELQDQAVIKDQLSRIDQSLASTLEMNNRLTEALRQAEEERKLMRNKTPLELAQDVRKSNRSRFSTNSDQMSMLDAKRRFKEPGTCLWIFEDSTWKRWRETGVHRVLWLSGSGGELPHQLLGSDSH